MGRKYMANHAIRLWIDKIGPCSKEKEMQALHETILHTVYPAQRGYTVAIKYQQATTEPDNKVMQIRNTQFEDVLTVELKRLKENPRSRDFDRVVDDQLDKHMAESQNNAGTILYGAVGIGHHLRFYKRVLPSQPVVSFHHGIYHVVEDAGKVQHFYDEAKTEAGWTDWIWREEHNAYERCLDLEDEEMWQYCDDEGIRQVETLH